MLRRLVPPMPSEPPDAYVAFVERHLEALRRDAARVVGDERDADQLYPEVLIDVAARWRWLDLMHTRLNQPQAGERYLRQAFARRSQRWQSEQVFPVDIQVWQPDVPGVTGMPCAPAWSSAALRLAAHVTPSARIEIRPIAEAAVAWWHAYEARRRRRVFVALGLLFLFVMLLARLQDGG